MQDVSMKIFVIIEKGNYQANSMRKTKLLSFDELVQYVNKITQDCEIYYGRCL